MTVKAILRMKGSEAVSTIAPTATIAECARRMASERIGALVVSADGARVEGIVSERDIVRTLAEQGGNCLPGAVSSAMTRKVESCVEADTADDILARMTAGRYRHMPVLRDGRLAALISIGDVVKYRISEIEMEKDALEGMIRGF